MGIALVISNTFHHSMKPSWLAIFDCRCLSCSQERRSHLVISFRGGSVFVSEDSEHHTATESILIILIWFSFLWPRSKSKYLNKATDPHRDEQNKNVRRRFKGVRQTPSIPMSFWKHSPFRQYSDFHPLQNGVPFCNDKHDDATYCGPHDGQGRDACHAQSSPRQAKHH
jgi:hypothetical protein